MKCEICGKNFRKSFEMCRCGATYTENSEGNLSICRFWALETIVELRKENAQLKKQLRIKLKGR
jgi:hypothetical protein